MKKLILVVIVFIAFITPGIKAQWWTVNEANEGNGPINYRTEFDDVFKEDNRGSFYNENYKNFFGKYSKKVFKNVPSYGPVYWYHILGVDEGAGYDEIIKTVKQLFLVAHPDKGGHDEAMKLVNSVHAEVKKYGAQKNNYYLEWNGFFRSIYNYNFSYQGPGKVPHAKDLETLFSLMGEDKQKKEIGDDFEAKVGQLTKSWKQFYLGKWAFYGLCVLGYKRMKKNKRVKRLYARWKQFKKRHPNLAKALEVSGRGSGIALMALYPLYKFKKFFSLGSLDSNYRSESSQFSHIENNERLAVFYKMEMVAWRRDHRGNLYPIKEPSPPVAYMTQEEARKNFMPLKKSKVMAALTVADSLVSAWMGCVL